MARYRAMTKSEGDVRSELAAIFWDRADTLMNAAQQQFKTLRALSDKIYFQGDAVVDGVSRRDTIAKRLDRLPLTEKQKNKARKYLNRLK